MDENTRSRNAARTEPNRSKRLSTKNRSSACTLARYRVTPEVMALAEAAELASFLVTVPPGERQETVFGQ